MISDEKIRQLIARGNEGRNLDYKRAFSWDSASKDSQIGIAKDVLSFANTPDGGVILVGVDDKTGEVQGLSEVEYASFDQTTFNEFMYGFTEPRHTSNVFRRTLDGCRLVAIEVPEFDDVPIICKKQMNAKSDPERVLLRKAGLYKRTPKATSELIEDADELRELLNRGVMRRQDELISAFNKIMSRAGEAGPASREEGFDHEIDEARLFLQQIADGALVKSPHWIVSLRPAWYVANRIPEVSQVQSAIRDSVVSLRGWDFPHIDNVQYSNFNRGFESSTDWKAAPFGRHVEGFRAYQSGLVVWASTLWEENASDFGETKGLSVLSTIFSFTEWMAFAKRYYEANVRVEDSIAVHIELHDAKGRVLVPRPPMMILLNNYVANDDPLEIIATVEMTDLRADFQLAARRLLRSLFELFNWTRVRDEMLMQWQRNLVEKRV